MNETFDVVVAGAGPVGLMLACELRLGGASVLVVERLTEPDPTVKAGGITVPTAQAFYRRGLLPELLRVQAAALRGLADFAPNPVEQPGRRVPIVGHFAGIMAGAAKLRADDPAFADLGPASEVMLVPQQEMEAILARRADELEIPLRRGAELTDFTDEGSGVSIRLGDTEIRASWLVGCDGGRSTVRKVAGFEFPGLDAEITGHQALAEIGNAEGLGRGWNSTENGIYVHGPMAGRFLTVELDGPPTERDAPITAAELQDSLRAVSGVPVEISGVRSATRFTDNTRQVPDYRMGRVLLAGDAAHIHSPFGGQGLNLGIGDAINLGWKLAAVVTGRASEDLLDTYSAERHPVGAWVLEWTRAQVALMRLDPRSRALRKVMTDLLDTPDGVTYLAKKLSGVSHRCDLGVGHRLLGASAPDFELSDGTRVGDHFHTGAGVLLDLSDSGAASTVGTAWSDRVRVIAAKPAQPREIRALLVRPDGVIAWATDGFDAEGLADALIRWFGAPMDTVA
ncbi:FAD-dependent oxidoreductase [Nocardia panacis]|uniref:FAD-dependent oxidoreductase n=1 Tax=Nocardia panacis TaxID=2340916 RepID=A0A3A4K0Y0_9NOCA|nr:FAD-dependent monooxygenase [Nocardia panacis]RJO70973.1 FAD-dependent oxidoreductase [Nocardia panacis]